MKLLEQFRTTRRKVYDELFSARALCIAGLIIMPALFFNPDIVSRVLLFLFFWFLAWLSGRKNNPVFTVLLIFGIIAFNLILPYGQVLVSIGALRITDRALMTGIHRAATLGALIMLSRVAIRQDLRIPGVFGELIGESFRLFSVIINQKQRVTRKNLISDIDRMMIELSNNAPQLDLTVESCTKPAGFIILSLVTILSWFPLVVLYLPARQ
jgi:heptaprenyl diphosphate synthase